MLLFFFFWTNLLQDLNETWYTFDPDFTPCFEQTVLVWAPCAFFWAFCIFDFYYLKASLDKNIPWNKLNISKLLLTLGLLVLTAIDFIMAMVGKGNEDTADLIYPVEIWTPVIKFATFVSIYWIWCNIVWMIDFDNGNNVIQVVWRCLLLEKSFRSLKISWLKKNTNCLSTM